MFYFSPSPCLPASTVGKSGRMPLCWQRKRKKPAISSLLPLTIAGFLWPQRRPLAHSSRCNGHLNLNSPIPVLFSSLIPKILIFTFHITCLARSNFTLIHGPNSPGSYPVFFTASDLTFTTRHIHNLASFLLWPSLFILSGAISLLFCSSILDTYRPMELIFQLYLVAFSFCWWGSWGKNTEVVCHSILQ